MSSTNLDMASDEDYHSESQKIMMRKKTSARYVMTKTIKVLNSQKYISHNERLEKVLSCGG